MRYKAQMVTTAIVLEKTVSDDHRRDTTKGEATETMATKKRSSRLTTTPRGRR